MDDLRGFRLRVPDENGDKPTPALIEARRHALLLDRAVLHSGACDHNVSTTN